MYTNLNVPSFFLSSSSPSTPFGQCLNEMKLGLITKNLLQHTLFMNKKMQYINLDECKAYRKWYRPVEFNISGNRMKTMWKRVVHKHPTESHANRLCCQTAWAHTEVSAPTENMQKYKCPSKSITGFMTPWSTQMAQSQGIPLEEGSLWSKAEGLLTKTQVPAESLPPVWQWK